MSETETIDRLYLELSQFSQSKTAKELRLEDEIARLREALYLWRKSSHPGSPYGTLTKARELTAILLD